MRAAQTAPRQANALAGTVLLGLLLAHASLAQGCDCNSIRLSPQDTPVCDEQNLTYANACLASCQSARNVRPCTAASGAGVGIASGAAARPFNPRHVDASAVLSPADFNRFNAEGFKLAAKLHLQPGVARRPGKASRQARAAGVSPARFGVISAARMTDTGLLYLQARQPGNPAGLGVGVAGLTVPQFAPGFRGTLPSPGSARGSRKMLQVGADDRFEITSTNGAHDYPFRTVGMLKSGCTATLISRSTLLSAGHCVYDTAERVFYKNLNWIPGRHDGGNHCHKWRGSRCIQLVKERQVKWATATTWFNNAAPPVNCPDDPSSTTCQTEEDFAYDISVIQLKEPVGKSLGYLGYGYSCASTTYQVTSAGYPGSLDIKQTRMYGTVGTLEAFSGCLAKTDTAGVITSDLDTSGGQSGSSIWDSKYYVRAIHVSGGPGHRSIVKDYYSWIKKNAK